MNKKPNFFIVGTPKAGTTSLYHYLEEHPEVFMSPIKETNYFSYDEIKNQGLYYNEEHISSIVEYENQFKEVKNEKAIGEASVSYLFYDTVPRKIKEFNPDARIIMILRNPIDRAFSHYLMDSRLGFTNRSLEAIIDNNDKSAKNQLYYQQYISIGLYYDQVKRYLDIFGEKNVKVFMYEDIVTDIRGVIREIYNFLQVDTRYNANTEKKHNVFLAPKNPLIQKLYASKAIRGITKKIFSSGLQSKIKNTFFSKEKKPILDIGLKTKMLDLFRGDIQKTAALINRDLSNWLR